MRLIFSGTSSSNSPTMTIRPPLRVISIACLRTAGTPEHSITMSAQPPPLPLKLRPVPVISITLCTGPSLLASMAISAPSSLASCSRFCETSATITCDTYCLSTSITDKPMAPRPVTTAVSCGCGSAIITQRYPPQSGSISAASSKLSESGILNTLTLSAAFGTSTYSA